MRLLVWVTLAGLIFGAIGFGEPVEETLRLARNSVRQHKASGDVVVVGVDDRSLDAIGKWPWSRQYHAILTDNLRKAGARKVVFDLDFSSRSDFKGDKAFAEALARSKGKVALVTRFKIDPASGERTDKFPLPILSQHAQIGTANFWYNGFGNVWSLPYALNAVGKSYPSLSAFAADAHGEAGETFPVDYSIDPSTVPFVSAVDVIRQVTPAEAIRGKIVIIGTTSLDLGDVYYLPGYRRMGGVYLHALGAETLKAGAPVDLGWLIPFILTLLVACLCLRIRNSRIAIGAMLMGAVAVLIVPLVLIEHRLSVQITPALFLFLVLAGSLAWGNFRHSYKMRGTINAVSGLPNLNALRQEKDGIDRPLIAARIQNYAQVASALPAEEEKTLVEQIASRLTVGTSNTKLYQGDEGIFAWFADSSSVAAIGGHLEALHQLFRSPITLAGNLLDLSITFGFDQVSERSLTNRLGSALVAADEAAAEGLKWKQYDSAKLKDASWKLSLLSQLDAAIDAEELWIAYQPKFDLSTRTITGAEALVRWTHPEKGPISPIEFVMAAEQSDRIAKLTDYVMERAIAAAAAVNARGIPFDLAVNLSARLIDQKDLPINVMAKLEKHGLSPERLTLEVTETAALNTSASSLETLLELRYMGVQISIDDYGTGLSTLDYLKRIPATEIKIDKSFVQALEKSRSDRLLVHSTIQLAHSLGQRVVAEGVEDQDTLNALATMGCDVAQGYFIGKPMPFKNLLRELLTEKKRRAA